MCEDTIADLPPRYLRRLQEAAAAAAAAQAQDPQNGTDIPHSPASTSQSATSPTLTHGGIGIGSGGGLSPSLGPGSVPGFLDAPLGAPPPPVQAALPPSRYPIAADGFHAQFPPLSMSVPSSFGSSRLPEHAHPHGHPHHPHLGRSPPQRHDEPSSAGGYGSAGGPSEQFSTYPLHNWAYKQHQQQPALPPSALPPLSYYYRPHRLEDVAPRDTMLLIIALFLLFNLLF